MNINSSVTSDRGLESVLRNLAENNSYVASKSVTFAGGTTNDMGDFDGTGNPYTLFTVTGDVLAYIVAVCKTNLAGATATLEVGVTGATAALIAQTTATDIDVNEGWFAATPTLAVANTAQYHVIGGGLDIIQTAGTANITSGAITYYCFWKALSDGASVVAA
jgi:hypothetical protein